MNNHILQTDNFKLSIQPDIYEDCINTPENTILHVCVENSGFSATTNLDIDIKEFAKFSQDLKSLYDKLSGEAIIKESYNMVQYIKFSADKTGHILVDGYLKNMDNELTFTSSFEQTYLQSFTNELNNSYNKYLD